MTVFMEEHTRKVVVLVTASKLAQKAPTLNRGDMSAACLGIFSALLGF